MFGSIFGVWNVFQSPGLDFRLIALGALLPLAARPAVRRAGVRAHAARRRCSCSWWRWRVTAGRGRRLRRRRCAEPRDRLVLRPRARRRRGRTRRCSGGRRSAPPARTSPLFPPWPVVVVEELLGLAAGVVGVDPLRPARRRRRRRDVRARPAGSTIVGERRAVIVLRAARSDRAEPRRPPAGPRRRASSSTRGREQVARARDAASRAERSPRSSSSPLRRARETAAAIAAVAGLRGRGRRPARSSSTTATGTAGRSPRSAPARVGRVARRSRRSRRPGGESLVAVTARVDVVLPRALAGARDGRVVAVSHVSPIKAAVVLGARRRRARDVAHAARRRVDHRRSAPPRRRRVPRRLQRRRAPRLEAAARSASLRYSTVSGIGARAGSACAPVASTTKRPSPGPSATGMPSASSSAWSSSAERPDRREVVADDQRVRAGEQSHRLQLAEHALAPAGEAQPRAGQDRAGTARSPAAPRAAISVVAARRAACRAAGRAG